MKPKLTFATRLAEAINRAGLSGTALAEASGLTRQSIHLLLQGDREPTLDTASKLATALNVSIDWLAGNQ
jgi:transcriptional regulator with XRE-family HTH domain